MRFFASGTDANLCALRLARAHTGKAKVAKVAPFSAERVVAASYAR
jgi:glutamate-1-semialdehyde aminotransferase